MYPSRSWLVRSVLILTSLLVIGPKPIVSAAGCSSANFRVASIFDFTRQPNFPLFGQTTADLNSDGKPDLILTDTLENSISVLLNKGGALFGETIRYAVGSRPSQIAVADFNTDGFLDLAIANSESNHVSILINTGAGQFASPTNLSVGGPQGLIAVADFNNDTRSDLVTGSANGGGVNVFLGNGSAGFSLVSGSPFVAGSSNSAIATADFNADNKRDVVVAGQTGVHLLLGDGTGALSVVSQVYANTSFAISSSDVNNDGKPDLVIGSSQLVIRLGDGAGGFSTVATFPHAGGGLVFSVGVADIDGDGHQDVAAAVGSGVTFFKGNGIGVFTQTPSYIPALEPRRVSIADLDGDSDQDLVSGTSLLLNSGGGLFDAVRAVYATSSGLTTSPREVASGDFNADGRTDIAVLLKPGFFGPHLVAVFLRQVSGEFTLISTLTISFANLNNALEVADFNNDGRSDIALAGSTTNSTLLAVALSNGNGSFATPINTNLSSPVSDTAAGDFNADGNQDLVITSGFGTISLLTGNGNGSFGQGSLFISGASSSVALSHLDADNKLDLVVTDTTNRRVITFINNGVGSFGNQRTFNLTTIPAGVVSGDFNGDSKNDIAVSTQSGSNNQPQGTIAVLLGDGTGNLGTAVSYSAGDSPGAIASADFNGDTKLDLAVTNGSVGGLESKFSDITILSGDGAGGFLSPVGFPVFGNPGPFAVSDFDSDGRLDLAVPLSGPAAVGLFYGKATSAIPCLFADDVSVNEGDSPANTSVTIRLSEPSAQPVQVNYLLTAEAAIENVDFQAGSGIVVFQPGETTKQVPLNIIDDNIDEDPEGMFLTLSFAQNACISDGSAKILIFDNDPPPTISINDISVTEGNSGEVSATFTVSLSTATSHGVFVNYATTNGTATSGTDYNSTQGTLIINPGVLSQPITVSVKGDNTLEPDETFFVNLSSPVDATIADGQGQATILNNDPIPAITIQDASTTEVVGADHNVTATVRLSNPSDFTVTVDYATADNTASAGSDYVATSGTVTFNPGETQKTFTVTIKEDTVDELIETFFINLSNPTNGVISDGQASISIDDNDGPTISINDVSLTEGQSGNKVFTFTLSLSAPTVVVAGVRIVTANGTAIAGDDYQGRPGTTVVIPAGMTSVTTNLTVFGDSIIESDETFFVNLSLPFGCTIADGQGVATILNDDLTSVQFSASNTSVSESAGLVTVTVQRVGDTSVPFTAFYSTFDSTASQKSDFTAALGKLDFAAGDTSKSITVFITDDVLVESPEEFVIFLSGPNGSRVQQPSSILVTINSDDAPGLPNPVDRSDFFVRQHYRDFLNRDPDPGGLAFWINEIESCGSDTQCREVKRINVSAAFFLSIEFQETGYFAYRTYKAVFGDTTSPTVVGTVPVIRLDNFLFDSKQIGENVQVGIGNWQQQLDDNKNKYVLEFVARPQFVTIFPISMTADQFVTKMNQQAGGVLSAEEQAELVAILGATPGDSAKRAQVLRRVAEDSNLHQNESNRAFVLMQYYGYLRRNPDDPQDTNFAGWKFWLDKLNQFGNFVDAEMVKAFLLSGEYRARFGN